jgi:hypothetical protein
MEHDPLASFRKKPLVAGGASAPAATTPPKEAEGYVAFEGKDKVPRLRIRRANAQTQSPGYAFLLNIAYDGEFGTNFVLFYTVLAVLVEGRNLQTLISALELGNVDYIQEFDPDVWEKPTDDKAAFIESIKVVVQGTSDAMAEMEQGRPQE